MSDRDDLLAIFKGHLAEVEALIGIAGSISLSCNDLKAQGDSGLEIRRLLGRLIEQHANNEMQLIDFLRGFGSQQPMTEKERREYKLKRVEDVLDITHEAYEQIEEYAQGLAA